MQPSAWNRGPKHNRYSMPIEQHSTRRGYKQYRSSPCLLEDRSTFASLFGNENRFKMVESIHLKPKTHFASRECIRRVSFSNVNVTGSKMSVACSNYSSSYENIPTGEDAVAYLNVLICGASGVGKKTMKTQFMSSETVLINDADIDDKDHCISVQLDKEETELHFINEDYYRDILDIRRIDVFLVLYSVNNADSFCYAIERLQHIRQELMSDNPVILVANKVDLERHRAITEKDARKIAEKYHCKYIETSLVFNHNIDDLLVGIVQENNMNRLYGKNFRRKEDTKSKDLLICAARYALQFLNLGTCGKVQ